MKFQSAFVKETRISKFQVKMSKKPCKLPSNPNLAVIEDCKDGVCLTVVRPSAWAAKALPFRDA